ncbi:hypothetical protein AAFO92_14475 [Roseovarius sp. CAU 1744]|uniref:trypsin-like peptidase domain-containing protein n=1 Tax=Roseovarius sp. CAU 1744 TaxID=3140368 RepID=UPI00325B2426
MAPNFFENFCVPVCCYKIDSGLAIVTRICGTAFYINKKGIFLSARHVFEDAFINSAQKNETVGLMIKPNEGDGSKTAITRVTNLENAPNKVDVCLGKTDFCAPTNIVHRDFGETLFQEVITIGYPTDAAVGEIGELFTNTRVHKGIVQRTIRLGDLSLTPSVQGYELSFVPARGMSGAPLLVVDKATFCLLGICIGSYRSEEMLSEIVEVSEPSREYRERTVAYNTYGVAQTLSPILDWKPVQGYGSSLREMFVGN